MKYLEQIRYEMSHQRLMTWISICGTALAIFLVMALFMTEQVKTTQISPESNRLRILSGENIHMKFGEDGDGSGSGIDYDLASKLYSGLDGVDIESFVEAGQTTVDVNVKDQDFQSVLSRAVDQNFWKIYDFRFIDGKAFDKGDVDAGAKVVVITRSVARSLFGEDNVSGREIEINRFPYRVAAVVEDANPLMNTSFANVYVPYAKNNYGDGYFGNSNVRLLLKTGIDADHVKEQVRHRYEEFARESAKDGNEPVYHNQPYTAEEVAMADYGSNNDPGLKTHKKMMWIYYCVLILLPAINLSSMTRGRLRHRVSEIGVRRAFGATRRGIVSQIITENFFITLFGGIIGLVFSIIFVLLASNLYFQFGGGLEAASLEIVDARPSFSMLFHWDTFFWALVFCFILNILSATVPAWHASKIEPAIAIAKSH